MQQSETSAVALAMISDTCLQGLKNTRY